MVPFTTDWQTEPSYYRFIYRFWCCFCFLKTSRWRETSRGGGEHCKRAPSPSFLVCVCQVFLFVAINTLSRIFVTIDWMFSEFMAINTISCIFVTIDWMFLEFISGFLFQFLLHLGWMAQLVEDSLIWSQLLIVTIWKIYVVTQLCCWDLNDGWSPNKKVTNEVRNSHQASSPSVKSSPPSTLTWWLRESRVNVLSTPKENSHELRQEERGEVQTVIIFMRASI